MYPNETLLHFEESGIKRRKTKYVLIIRTNTVSYTHLDVYKRQEYSHRVTVSGRDELSRLGDEFNELTGRLQTTEEVRRRFVSDASHELKTPLASIRLLADSILQTDGMDPETVREFVSDIGDEAERLTRITEKLLTLTRMDTAPPCLLYTSRCV